MRKTLSLLLSICIILGSGTNKKSYANTNNIQAAWLTTAWSLDWPKTKNNPTAQKNELIEILDTLKDTGINTVMFQVRPYGDAMYKSNINPWSKELTGTQGKDPGYDPLEVIIQEAHTRGIKVHAWLNPYRVISSGTDVNVLSGNHPARKNPSLLIENKGGMYYNPDLQEVKNHISDTIAEIVSNYNVDGITFDDYFYPTNYPLPEGEEKDGAVANARREHINQMILQVKNTIKSIKPWVRFGVSPRGVWKNKINDPNGSDTGYAKESYYSDYADTVKWVKEGYIDYIIPQVYWEMDHNVAPFKTVTNWWENIVKGTNVDLYIGHTTDKDVVAKEIDTQIQYTKQFSAIKGNSYYNVTSIMNNNQGSRDKIKNNILQTLPFNDIENHWAKNEIIDFANKGYLNGRSDGKFYPNDTITRAEFVKVINKMFGLTKTSGVTFSDVPDGYWAKTEIDIAFTNGVAKGYGEGKFKPDAPITRQEAIKMIANYLKISDTNHDKISTFPDYNQIADWAKNELEAAVEKGYIKGNGGMILPKANMSRAEAVTMLSRIK